MSDTYNQFLHKYRMFQTGDKQYVRQVDKILRMKVKCDHGIICDILFKRSFGDIANIYC